MLHQMSEHHWLCFEYDTGVVNGASQAGSAQESPGGMPDVQAVENERVWVDKEGFGELQ